MNIKISAALIVLLAPSLQAAPNVLFIVADDLNENLGAFGHPLVQTPHLDSLAARSVRFQRAYAQWPVCGPSRASFLTGLYPDQTGIKDLHTAVRDTLPDAVTLPQYFKNHGYQSARVGKLYHMNNPNGIGQNGEDDPQSWSERFNPAGVDVMPEVKDEIFILNNNGTAWVTGSGTSTGARLSYLNAQGLTSGGIDKGDPLEHTDGKVATKAVELISTYSGNPQPFFLAVGFFKPHTPFVAPQQFFDLYDPNDIVIPAVPANYLSTLPAAAVATITERTNENNLDPVIARQTIHAYYATISFMDSQIGRVVAALDDPNGDGDTSDSIRDNTVIVFLSDHGYHMGEHDKYQKTTLFEDACRTPLMISAPGTNTAGEATQSLAELTDLYKTLAELAGLPQPDDISGTSLAPVLANTAAIVRSSALTQQGGNYTIRTDRYRYTRWGNGGAPNIELYDHEADPQELDNLAHSDPGTNASIIADLEAQLTNRVREAQPELFLGTADSIPFGGTARKIPSTVRIEAEDYDTGGATVAFSDTTTGNDLNGTYRTDDVDIAVCLDTDGGFNIGGFESGEWMAYTVDVEGGIFDISFRLASNNTSNLAGVEVFLEGQLLGTVTAPASGGWQNWVTVKLEDVVVTPGGKSRKLVLRRTATGQKFNMNWVEFAMKSTSFNLWKTKFEGFDSPSSGNTDGDYSSNGMEYAFDTDPTDSSDSPAPGFDFDGTAAQVTFRRQRFDANLTYTPQWSADLTDWYSTGFTEKSVITYDTVDDVTLKKLPEAGQNRIFIRVKAEGF